MIPELSILIPCFNEAARISATVLRIKEYVLTNRISTEIIFYDDGSTDSTRRILEELAKQELVPAGISVQVHGSPSNRGKGYAVREGGKLASKKWLLITDADLSVPISDLDKFLPYVASYELIIGSRRTEGGNVEIPQKSYRVVMGGMFSALSRWMMGVNVRDFTCGFKLLSSTRAQSIFARMTIDRWAYDSELLKIAAIDGVPIKEIGVTWRDDRGSKVRLSRDIFGSFVGLLIVMLRAWRGDYASE